MLAEVEDYKSRFETLMIENQCTLRLTVEAKKLLEKLAKLEKADAALKTAFKGRGKKRATPADKRVATLETEVANSKPLHSRLVEVATHYQAGVNKAPTNLQDSLARLVKFEREAKMAREGPNKVRKQFVGSAEAAKKALRQLTEMSN